MAGIAPALKQMLLVKPAAEKTFTQPRRVAGNRRLNTAPIEAMEP
jgi:hypothetical protein